MNPLVPRLWSTRHLDFALRLQGNVSDIARRGAPDAEVWISESNSICHQGVNGVTNAYLNSLWLVNRLGIMANAGVRDGQAELGWLQLRECSSGRLGLTAAATLTRPLLRTEPAGQLAGGANSPEP